MLHAQEAVELEASGMWEGAMARHADSLRLHNARGGGPLGFSEGDGLASMIFGPRHAGQRGRSEDDRIVEQLAAVRQVERNMLARLRVPATDEAPIEEQAQRMREAQRLRGVATDMPDEVEDLTDADAALTELAANAEEDKELAAVLAASRKTAQHDDTELDAALALSAALSAEADDAALVQALQSSTECADATPAPESTEAGVDIPFETPKSLLADAPAVAASSTPSAAPATDKPSAATSNKSSRGKSKRAKARGSQV